MKDFLDLCTFVLLIPAIFIGVIFLIHLLPVIGMILLIVLPIIGFVHIVIQVGKSIIDEIKSENKDGNGRTN